MCSSARTYGVFLRVVFRVSSQYLLVAVRYLALCLSVSLLNTIVLAQKKRASSCSIQRVPEQLLFHLVYPAYHRHTGELLPRGHPASESIPLSSLEFSCTDTPRNLPPPKAKEHAGPGNRLSYTAIIVAHIQALASARRSSGNHWSLLKAISSSQILLCISIGLYDSITINNNPSTQTHRGCIYRSITLRQTIASIYFC